MASTTRKDAMDLAQGRADRSIPVILASDILFAIDRRA